MAPVGSIIFGVLTQLIGSRITLMTAAILHTICYLLFYYACNATMLLLGVGIIGSVYTVTFVSGCAYIAEVSQPNLRATFLASNNLALIIGHFYSILLSTMLHWRIIALANCGIPILGFITMCFVPDSPQWLASKGRLVQAERALAWLRGWTTSQNVQHEFEALKKGLDDQKIHENEKILRNSNSNQQSINKSRKFLISKEDARQYLHKSFYIPIVLVCYMFALHAFSGSLTLNTYAVIIFNMSNSPIEKYTATSIYEGLKVLSSVSCFVLIKYTGKRKLAIFSLTGTILSYLIISTVLFLISQAYISTIYSWITTVMIMIAGFLTAGGIDKIIHMLNVEILPTEYRGIGGGVALFVSTLLISIANKIFLSMINVMTLPGVYLFFACVYIVALLSFYLMVPETNGRTLMEIQEHITGVRKLKPLSKGNLKNP